MDQNVDGTRLSGVPETTLWTLYNRASEAARPDALIHDPWAVHLPITRISEPSADRLRVTRCERCASTT